jgi:hypothetical protein
MSHPYVTALYLAAPVNLRVFMDAHLDQIEAHVVKEEARIRHQARVIAATTEPLTTEFIVPIAKLDKVNEEAHRLGVKVETEPLNYKTVFAQLEGNLIASISRQVGISQDSVRLKQHEIDFLKESADDILKEYITIHAVAPPVEDRVIAVAEHDDDGTKFINLPYEEPFWKDSNMGMAVFSRCDVCHQPRARKKLFVIKGRTHGVRLVGGECAKHMHLGEKLADLLHAFKSFSEAVVSMSSKEDDHKKAIGEVKDPSTILLAADIIIQNLGYTSQAKAKTVRDQSTTSYVREFLIKGETSKDIREEYSRRYAIGDNIKLLQEATVFADELYKKSVATGQSLELAKQVKSGVEKGGVRAIGALAWLVSQLPEWRAARGKKHTEEYTWMPSMKLKPIRAINYSVNGPNPPSEDSGIDDRVRVAVALADTPQTFARADMMQDHVNPHIGFACAYPEVSLALIREFRMTVVPPGKFLSIGVFPQASEIRNALDAGRIDGVMGMISKTVRSALYRLGDLLEFEPTIDTLRDYEKQEPGFATRMDIMDTKPSDKKPSQRYTKALQTGVLAQAALAKLARVLPGVWTNTGRHELTQTAFGTPQLYTFKRDDGALVNIKSSGMLYKQLPTSERWSVYIAYLETGDLVYLGGDFKWPVQSRMGVPPAGTLTRASFSFSEGKFPNRLLWEPTNR